MAGRVLRAGHLWLLAVPAIATLLLAAPAAGLCNCSAAAAAAGCPVEQDVVFVLAASEAGGQAAVRDFLEAVLNRMALPVVQAGLVVAESSPRELSPLVGDLDLLQQRAASVPALAGEVYLGPALQRAALMLAAGRDSSEKLVFVVADVLPVDPGALELRSGQIQALGARCTLLWIRAPLGISVPASLLALASAPSSTNVLEVGTYGDLAVAAVTQAPEAIRQPCPCPVGARSSIFGPRGLEAVASSTVLLRHGETEVQTCALHFPSAAGELSLTCSDGALRAASACVAACDAGTAVALQVGGQQWAIELITKLPIGGVEEQNCSSVVPGTSGAVRLLCQADGGLEVHHQCETTCGSAAEAVDELVPWTGKALAVRLPAGGLPPGGWLPAACGEHFPGTEGALSCGCLGGSLQVLGDCAEPGLCGEVQLHADRAQGFGWAIFALGNLALLVGLCSMVRNVVLKQGKARSFVSLGVQVDDGLLKASAGQTPPRAVALQTEPQLRVELARGGQLPLDLVICVDAALLSDAGRAVQTLACVEQVIEELDLPPVRVGLLGFSSECAVWSELSSHRDSLLAAARGAQASGDGTALAPPLRAAAALLAAAAPPGGRRRAAAVVLLGSGPSDAEGASREAQALRTAGVTVSLVQVGGALSPTDVRRLVSQPTGDHVLEVRDVTELCTVPDLLLPRILEESCYVRRARVAVNEQHRQLLSSGSTSRGCDCLGPGWERSGADCWTWDPLHPGRLLQSEVLPWRSDLSIARAPCSTPLLDEALQRPAAAAATAAEDPGQLAAACTQTDPVMRVELRPGRQAPLDLLICVDTFIGSVGHHSQAEAAGEAAPGSGPRPSLGLGQCLWTGAHDESSMSMSLRSVADVIGAMVADVKMPEVQLGLATLSDAEPLCDITPYVDELFRKLGELGQLGELDAGAEPRPLAPALRRAAALLRSRPREAGHRAQGFDLGIIDKAVLLFVSGPIADEAEAAAAAEELLAAGTRVVLVDMRPGLGDAAFVGLLPSLTTGSGAGDASSASIVEMQVGDCTVRDLASRLLAATVRVVQCVARGRCLVPAAPPAVLRGDAAVAGPVGGVPIDLQDQSASHLGAGGPYLPVTEAEAVVLSEEALAETLQRDISSLEDEGRTIREAAQSLRSELEHWRRADTVAAEAAKDAELGALRLEEQIRRELSAHRGRAEGELAAAARRLEAAQRRRAAAEEQCGAAVA